jgi:hypothetical protein
LPSATGTSTNATHASNLDLFPPFVSVHNLNWSGTSHPSLDGAPRP